MIAPTEVREIGEVGDLAGGVNVRVGIWQGADGTLLSRVMVETTGPRRGSSLLTVEDAIALADALEEYAALLAGDG